MPMSVSRLTAVFARISLLLPLVAVAACEGLEIESRSVDRAKDPSLIAEKADAIYGRIELIVDGRPVEDYAGFSEKVTVNLVRYTEEGDFVESRDVREDGLFAWIVGRGAVFVTSVKHWGIASAREYPVQAAVMLERQRQVYYLGTIRIEASTADPWKPTVTVIDNYGADTARFATWNPGLATDAKTLLALQSPRLPRTPSDVASRRGRAAALDVLADLNAQAGR